MANKTSTLLTDRDKPEYCLAIYIYYAEPWEDLLVKAIKPVCDWINENQLVSRYFFIRYWERGPHIRLRFFGDEKILENLVKPRVEAILTSWMSKNPSHREEPEWVQTLPTEEQWYPNNSLQYIRYEPETDRYGGSSAITVSEDHFQQSSEITFTLLKESPDWSYDRALGAAIQLHLSFAHAAGMTINEAREFFSFIFGGWFPRAYRDFGNETPEEIEEKKTLTLKAFEENFAQQKDTLVQYHQMLWKALDDKDEFEEEWLNVWIKQTTELVAKLRLLQYQSKLQFPPDTTHLSGFNTAFEKQKFWFIYSSYVHMTNNRLGIQNRDEGYLGYLIRESL